MGIYNIGNGHSGSGATTLSIGVGSGTGSPQGAATGDLVVVCCSNSGTASQAINTPTDSQGNTYVLIPGLSLGAAGSQQQATFACFTTAPLVSGVDSVVGNWAVVGGNKQMIVKGCDGISSATADKAIGTTGTSVSPSSGASGTLTQAAEAVFGFINNASTGGAPTAPSFGAFLSTQSASGGFLSEIDELVNATTAQTASGTIVSAAWCAAIATFKISAPSIATASLPAGSTGAAYSFNLTNSGGTKNFTYAITSGTLSGSGVSLASSGLLSGTGSVPGNYTCTYQVTDGAGQTATKSLTLTITGPPFPSNPLPILVEVLLGGTWTDITDFIYQRDDIVVTGGTPAQGSAPQPSTMQITLNNQDGRFSPSNVNGAFYPYLQRNVQIRLSVQAAASSAGATYTGYRFWGTVPDWAPTSDISGQDIYVKITANGPLRQVGQGNDQTSPLFRYYQSLQNTQNYPIAYWPVEDDVNSNLIGSGIDGGIDMTVASGLPVWKATSDFPGSGPVARINKSTWTGVTSAFGTSGDDVFDTPGVYNWVASTTSVNVRCWGGGGGGTKGQQTSGVGGSGGGGGEFAQETTLAVTPGKVYQVTVGAGGTQGNRDAGGSPGGLSTFTGDSVTVTANGGSGAGANGASGAGGTGSTNTIHNGGGAGGTNNGVLNGGGAGGGSGGATSAGGAGQNAQSGSQSTGGSAGTGTPPGAAGGNGGYQTSGRAGNLPGGGGGGGWGNVENFTIGGNGASGQVELVYAASGGPNGGSVVLTSGTQWIAPTGVTSVKVECVAGGGSGGGNVANGAAGTNSVFTGNAVTVTAHGGGGGTRQSGGGAAGAGGSGSTNTTHNSGGSGASGASQPFGGGGGGSGGSGSAGNPGSGSFGGAAVTGGGAGGSNGGGTGSVPGGAGGGVGGFVGGGGGGGGGGEYAAEAAVAVTAGSAYTYSIGQGGTGGGGSGANGQITVTWAAGGTQPPYNVVRFIYETPAWGIYPNNSVLLRVLGNGTIARYDIIGVSGGKLQVKGYNSGGTLLFTSSNLNVGDAVPAMVSLEVNNSGTSVAYRLAAIGTNGLYNFIGSVNGTQASAAIGSVSQVIVCPNGDITKAVVGQISVQYTLVTLFHLSNAFVGGTNEMGIDRFIRLCAEQALGSEQQFNEKSDHWGFETGVEGWAGTGHNCTVAQSTTAVSNPLNIDFTIYTHWPIDGTHSLKITSSALGAFDAFSPGSTNGQPVNAGDIVTVGAEVYAPSGANNAYCYIRWLDVNGNQVTPDAVGNSIALVTGGIGSVYAKGTAPATAVAFNVHVGDNDPAAALGTVIYTDNVRTSPQMGKQTKDNYRQLLQQIEDLEQGMLKEAKDIWGLKYRTRISLINQTPVLVLDYSQVQIGGDYGSTLLVPEFDDKLTANSITVHRHNGSRVTVSLAQGSMSTQLPPLGVGKHGKQARVMANDDAQLLALAQHLLNLGTVTDERYPDVPVNLARSELAATGSFDTVPVVEIGDYIRIVNLPSWYPSTSINQLVVGYTETLNAFRWDFDFNCQPASPYLLTATSIRRW